MGDYLVTEDIGYVRLLISDTAGQTDTARIFTDDEITEVVRREGGLKLAAATLLLIIASNEALLLKSIQQQDLRTDGPALAAELRAQAGELRRQGAEESARSASTDGPMVVEFCAPRPWPELAERPW